MHRVPILFVVLWLSPLQSSAIGLVTFDSARLLAAEEVELSASLNGGDDAWAGSVSSRLGLGDGFELSLNVGALSFGGRISKETQIGGQMRLLSRADTGGWIDISASFRTAFLFNQAVLAVGFDPKVTVSRHFSFSRKRAWFLAISGGAAITVLNISGPGDHEEVGPLAMITVGIDTAKNQGIRLGGGLRDNAFLYGVSYLVNF